MLLRQRRIAPLNPERLAQLAPHARACRPVPPPGGQFHPHHPRHGARPAGQRAALRHEADGGGAGQVHALQSTLPPSTSCAGTTPRGATSQTMPLDFAISKDFRKLLAFGSGVGVEIGATDLEVAVTRVRPNKIQVLGRLTIENYAARPAAEWGAEYARFLKASRRRTPQRHRPAAAPRSHRAAACAARRGRRRISRAPSASSWIPSTPTATTRWCGAGRRSPTAACWWASSCAAPSNAMSLSLWKPASRCAASPSRRRRFTPPSA